MHLLFDIFQGIGIAAAVGIRPFLPALASAALADAGAEIHFNHTDFSFLQSPEVLLGMAVGAILLAVSERRTGRAAFAGPLAVIVAICSVVLGALFFGGSLCRGHYAVWPGLVGGAICALIGIAATRPLFERVRARLDPAAAAALPLHAEAAGVTLAVLSILAPPVGPIALAGLLWVLVAGRRREGQKYAGLRILR